MTLLGIYKLDKLKTWMKGERRRDRKRAREVWRLEGSLRNRVVSALPSGSMRSSFEARGWLPTSRRVYHRVARRLCF